MMLKQMGHVMPESLPRQLSLLPLYTAGCFLFVPLVRTDAACKAGRFASFGPSDDIVVNYENVNFDL